MGLINAMGNWFTNQNEIQRAQEESDRRQRLMDASNQSAYGVQPRVQQSAQEAQALKNQGWLPTHNPAARSYSPTAHVIPERGISQAWSDYADQGVQQASDDYQAYLDNPLNTVVDRALDVANLPFSLIGERFFADPSAKAEKKYKQALDDAQQISGTAQRHYLDQRTARDKTFSDSMGGGGQNPAAVKKYLFRQGLSEEDQKIFDRMQSYSNTTKIGTGDSTLVVDRFGNVVNTFEQNLAPEQKLGYLADKERQQAFVKAQSTFTESQPNLQSALKSARQKHKLLKVNIEKALELVRTARGVGWNGLLRTLPESIAKDLDATLKTIKANVAFERLQEMRINSPTGGALGNVSDREIELLYNSLMPIDQLGSDQLLENSLKQIMETNKLTLDNMRDAYNQDLGRYGGRPQADNTEPAKKPPLNDEQKNRLKEHDKLFGL